MSPRRDLRREISRARKQLQFAPKSMTTEQRELIMRRVKEMEQQLKAKIEGRVLTVTDEEIDSRQAAMAESPELLETFHVFWSVMLPFTVDGVLQKAAYVKLQCAFQYSFLGTSVSEETALANAEADWVQDSYLFGPMNQAAFQNMLFEMLHCWLDHSEDFRTYAVYAWCLLQSVADVSKHPPEIRPRRTIRCIGNLAEGLIYKEYSNDTSLRSKIYNRTSAEGYFSSENVSALNRATQRSKNIAESNEEDPDAMQLMLAVIERRAAKMRAEYGEAGSGTDSDDDITVDDSVVTEDTPEWRRLQLAREKAERERLRLLAAGKKKRRALKKKNARSYFLEVGRGMGADALYSMESPFEKYGADVMSIIPGMNNWIGHVGQGKEWQKAMLLEFLATRLGWAAEGLTPEQLRALAVNLDIHKLKLLWMRHLQKVENESRYLKVFEANLGNENELGRLTGMFGIAGKTIQDLEKQSKARRESEEALQRKSKEYGSKALEALRELSRKRQGVSCGEGQLRNVILTATGEMAIRRPEIKRLTSPPSPPKATPAANLTQRMQIYTNSFKDVTTPSYFTNQRSESTRPTARSKVPAPLIPKFSSRNQQSGESIVDHGSVPGLGSIKQMPSLRLQSLGLVREDMRENRTLGGVLSPISIKSPTLPMFFPDVDDSASESSKISGITGVSTIHSNSKLHARSLATFGSLPPQLQRRFINAEATRRSQLNQVDNARNAAWQASKAAEALGKLSDRYGFEFEPDETLLQTLETIDPLPDPGLLDTQHHIRQAATPPALQALLHTPVGMREPPFPPKYSLTPTQSVSNKSKLQWDDDMVKELVTKALELHSHQQEATADIQQRSRHHLQEGGAMEENENAELFGVFSTQRHSTVAPSVYDPQASVLSSLPPSSLAGSTINTIGGSSSSRSSSGFGGKPQLILPPLLVVLESLYLQADTTRNSLLNRPAWKK